MVFIQDCYCRLSPTGPAIDKVTHIDEVSLIAASQNRNMTTLTTSRHQPPAYKPSSELLQLKSPAKVYRLPSDETSSTPGPEQGHWKPAQGQAQPPQPLHQYDGPRSHSSAAVEQKALGHSMAVDLEVAVSAIKHQQARDLLVVVSGLILLIGPLWLLNALPTERQRLTATSTLIAGFTGMLYIIGRLRPVETLVTAATYAAVLVVFLQFGHNGT